MTLCSSQCRGIRRGACLAPSFSGPLVCLRASVSRRAVKVLDFADQIATEFAASPDTLSSTFLVEDKTHNNAFIATDIQRADAHLTAFFRSLK